MKIKEFVKEEIIIRANAAKDLKDSLDINGMHICAGCDSEGVQIYDGIEKIAAIMDEELHSDIIEDEKRIIETLWFTYGVDEDAVKFYQREYRAKKSEPKDNPAARGEF